MYKFEDMYEKQVKINDYIFFKRGLGISTDQIQKDSDITWNGSKNKWLKNYLWALKDECRELEEELLDKWWSTKELDTQNIKVEIIDMFHFWLSLAITAGMGPQEIYDMYMLKNEVNKQRQDADYHEDNDKEMGNEQVK